MPRASDPAPCESVGGSYHSKARLHTHRLLPLGRSALLFLSTRTKPRSPPRPRPPTHLPAMVESCSSSSTWSPLCCCLWVGGKGQGVKTHRRAEHSHLRLSRGQCSLQRLLAAIGDLSGQGRIGQSRACIEAPIVGTKEQDHGLDKDNTPCPSKRHLSSARVASQRKKRRTSLLRSLLPLQSREATPLDGGEESGVSLESVELASGRSQSIHARSQPNSFTTAQGSPVLFFSAWTCSSYLCNALGCSRLPHGTTL
jgi:hypothetical protein